MADGSNTMERAERRGSHLAFVAHEVRNPLSTALWSAELLARLSAEERGGARGEKLAAMCLRSVARVRQLIEDHFLCERLDVSGISTRTEAVGLRDVLDAVVSRRPGDVGEVALDVDPELAVEADRGLLERALDALVAVAGREGVPVRVRAETDDDTVMLLVHGREPEHGALEDPARGSPGDTKGRALALPVARRVAASTGGALVVVEGAYALSLPRAKPYPARPKPAAHP